MSSISSSSSSSSSLTPPSSPTLIDEGRGSVKKQRTCSESHAERSVSEELFDRYLEVQVSLNGREVSELKKTELSTLLKLANSYDALHITKSKDQITFCEIALYLARHYTSRIKSDPTHAHLHRENAAKYHSLATKRFGSGKYDLRGDACWNAGSFYEKQSKHADPSRKKALLLEALDYYKKAAKSTFNYSEETAEYSCYSDISRVFTKLAELTDNPIEKKGYSDKSAIHYARSQSQIDAQGKVDNLTHAQIRQANYLDSKTKAVLEAISNANGTFTKNQIKESAYVLGFESYFLRHSNSERTIQYLKRRAELALSLGEYYASKNRGPLHLRMEAARNAIKYFKIAQTAYGVGKYDVDAKSFRGHGRMLMWFHDQRKAQVQDLLTAAQCYEKAAKASASLSDEMSAIQDLQKAIEIYAIIQENQPDHEIAVECQERLKFLINLKTAQAVEESLKRAMPIVRLSEQASIALENYSSLEPRDVGLRGKARVYEVLAKRTHDQDEEHLLNSAKAYLLAAYSISQNDVHYESLMLDDLSNAALHFSDLAIQTGQTHPYLNLALVNGKKVLGIEGEISEELLDSYTSDHLLPRQRRALTALRNCLNSPKSSTPISSSSSSSDLSRLPPKLRYKRLTPESDSE